ncbi:MAG: alpha/beta hydrolase [Pseudomonadales bacterium]
MVSAYHAGLRQRVGIDMRGVPREHRFHTSELGLCYFEWGQPDAPPVLLLHATGFHARCWDQTVAALPEGYRVVAVDMRGHGRSDKRPPYEWPSFARDIVELVQALDLRDAVGVGHSMGGHCLTQVAARLPGAFQRLLLVDPVIVDPESYGSRRHGGFATAEDHPVARRRALWRSPEEMIERFRDRHPFSLWQPQVLEDYCRHGLLPHAGPEDGYELACPPVVEASIYMGSAATDIYDLIPTIDIPVVVLRAPGRTPEEAEVMDFSKSPTWPGLAARFPHGRDVYLPQHSHFIPMQDPALVARFIVDPQAEAAAGAAPGSGTAAP